MSTSCDGQYVVSVGQDDCAINLWQINPTALDSQVKLGGEGYEPFIAMLPGGKDGAFYHEFEDYFFYAQLRIQGEETTDARLIHRKCKIEHVPSIFQAMGYYPSEQEIQNLFNEIKYNQVIQTGDVTDAITFDEIIKRTVLV
jgi:hypothetical protein